VKLSANIVSQYKLQTEGFDDDDALDETIKKLESDLKKARKKEAAADGGEDAEEPTFPLVDVPDADVRFVRGDDSIANIDVYS
jgi:actin-related protein 5